MALQNLGSETPDQLLGENGADALDQTAAEVSLYAFCGGRRNGLHHCRLELEPVFLVPYPQPSATSHSPAVTEGSEPTTVVSSR